VATTKREHVPGPTRSPAGSYGKWALRCSCGKRVTSTGGQITLWDAYRKHVARAQARAHKQRTEGAVPQLTEQISAAALHLAKRSTPEQLAKLEDGLRTTLLELEEAATYYG
jgi:hypothetical protein